MGSTIRKRLVLYGGWGKSYSSDTRDTWEWDSERSTKRQPSTSAAEPDDDLPQLFRDNRLEGPHQMAYDVQREPSDHRDNERRLATDRPGAPMSRPGSHRGDRTNCQNQAPTAVSFLNADHLSPKGAAHAAQSHRPPTSRLE